MLEFAGDPAQAGPGTKSVWATFHPASQGTVPDRDVMVVEQNQCPIPSPGAPSLHVRVP
jgi:hypothetical protein